MSPDFDAVDADLKNKLKVLQEMSDLDEFRSLLAELISVYEQFHATSNRVIKVLSQFTPSKTSKKGLSDFIISTLIRYKDGAPESLIKSAVDDEFEHEIDNRAVKDSLRYLVSKGVLSVRTIKGDIKMYSIKYKSKYNAM